MAADIKGKKTKRQVGAGRRTRRRRHERREDQRCNAVTTADVSASNGVIHIIDTRRYA